MPNIESVKIIAGHRLKLDVVSSDIYPERDLYGQPVEAYDSDTIYDRDTKPPFYHPAVVNGSRTIRLSITVSSIDSEYMQSKLRLETEDTGRKSGFRSEVVVPSQDSQDGGNTVVFTAQTQYSAGFCFDNPAAYWGHMEFYIYDDDKGRSAVIHKERMSIPMELYIINHELPKLFLNSDKQYQVPLLLLRMFVGAATASGVCEPSQWVAMVTKIVHGSAEPMTGTVINTENHWLKYECTWGNFSFISEYTGGTFRLWAWLDAYRYWKARGTLTYVNCYDQAGAVEIALSFGIDYNCVAWEFHQWYGHIAKTSQLVGWGYCNNPYFARDLGKKIMKEDDLKRDSFRNHVFLSWSPEFEPQNTTDFYETYKDPNEYDAVTMYAIDACAGPCIGDLVRGKWVDPFAYPADYRDGKTYWTSRDTNFSMEAFKKKKENNLSEGSKATKNFWLSGVTGLRNDSKTVKNPLPLRDPLKDIDFSKLAPPTGSDMATKAFGGKIDTIQNTFAQETVTGSWKRIDIAGIQLGGGSIEMELKLYDNNDPQLLNYVSLRITVTPSNAEAQEALKTRAAAVIITSKLEPKDFSPMPSTGGDGALQMLVADFTILFTHGNLLVEVSGLSTGKLPLVSLAQAVCADMHKVGFVDSSKWRECV